MTTRRRYSFREYLNPRVLTMTVLGFSSGLPFVLVGNTFGYWLRDEGTNLAAIGFLSWVGLAYSLKFLWAPILDRVGVPLLSSLGLRRGWIALAQLVVAAGLMGMAWAGVSHGLVVLGVFALIAAFASSTQDIA
ncbi:MAG: MFS transporter, partial [Rhizomicrobium sp.]